jgi:uncharacterized protein
MRVLFNIGHPAQVHLFKNLIWALEDRGHECKITVIDKDVSIYLLKKYGFHFEIVGSSGPSLLFKARELIKIESKLLRLSLSFKPDILVGGVGNAYVCHVGKLLQRPSIVFDDTEHAKLEHFLMDPFASVICTPSCYKKDLGEKQVRYNGYHELAYLHPDYFTPDRSALDELGLDRKDFLIVMRFVSWGASHDIGNSGIKNKKDLVKKLEKYGTVLITSEAKLDASLEKYKMKIPPERLHDLLYYATLYIGEGAKTASESAVLGTHAIYANTLRSGITDEEENKYNLLFNINNGVRVENQISIKAKELLESNNLWHEGKTKREKLLAEKIDVTRFMVDFVENMIV